MTFCNPKDIYYNLSLLVDNKHFNNIDATRDIVTTGKVKGMPDLEKLFVDNKYEIMAPIASSDIVVINEVDKASSNVRNSLLGVMNEKFLFNGKSKIPCNWQLFVATCNEIPKEEENSPFWDRFMLKVNVSRISAGEMTKYYANGAKNYSEKFVIGVPSQAEIDALDIPSSKLEKFLEVGYNKLSDRTLTFVPNMAKAVSYIWNISIDKALVKVASIMINNSAGSELQNKLYSPEVKALMSKIEQLNTINTAEEMDRRLVEIEGLIAGYASQGRLDESQVAELEASVHYIIDASPIKQRGQDIEDIFSEVVQSGAVYTYDYLRSANESATNPGKFVFGLQITDSNIYSYDVFGASVSYVDGVLMVGASGNDATAADSSGSNYGRVFVFENATRTPAWTPLRIQQPVVDIRLLNSVFTYDVLTSARTQQFDFFNPLQGKILGAAKQNINYISAIDPAGYNVGPVNNSGNTWLGEHVGQVWWDISTVRFIDPNQDDIVYASRRWGQVFPGSTIDMYQWIQSSVPPATYTGEGTPLNIYSYTVSTRLGVDGTFNTYYYFWVKGLTTVATQQGKTLSPQTVANYIENPKASGIAYIAPVNASTIAIYNATTIIEAEDTVISVEFDREYTDSNVHVEYELIAQGKSDAFLSTNLYRKLQDSFCGVDTAGNLVPDPTLNAAERYGVQFRPRQSMFVDRFEALKNYIVRTNNVLSLYPIVENRSFVLLNSSEPEPPSTAVGVTNWNMRVANLEILSFQDISVVPIGYKYLVASDSRNNGLWTIYTVQYGQGVLISVKELVLTRVQNYDTRRYWSYVNWYRPGYNSSTKVIAEVPNYSALATISVPIGSSVKVISNAQGKFEIYLFTDLGWERVGLQDGTIEISAEIYKIMEEAYRDENLSDEQADEIINYGGEVVKELESMFDDE